MKHIKLLALQSLMMIAVSLIITAIVSYPVSVLWNLCLVPVVNIVTEISWMQAWGIMLMVNLLIKTGVEFKSQ